MLPDNHDDTAARSRMPEIRVPGLLTLFGLLAGLGAGLLLAKSPWLPDVLSVAGPVGTLWLQGLKMTILPLVAGLLFTGIVETAAAARAGAMARRTVAFIVGALALSATVGALLMPALLAIFAPARDLGLGGAGAGLPTPEVPGIGDFFLSLIPGNVVTAAANR